MSAHPTYSSSKAQVTRTAILQETLRKTPELEGMLVIRTSGEVTDVAGAHEDKLRQLASFAIGSFELSERLASESGRGDVQSHLIRTDAGHIALHRVEDDTLLFALASGDAPMGLLAHDLGWCAGRLANVR